MTLSDVHYQHWDGRSRGIWRRRAVIAGNGLRGCLQGKWTRHIITLCWGAALAQVALLFFIGQLLVADSMVSKWITHLSGPLQSFAKSLVVWLEQHPEISVRATQNLLFLFLTAGGLRQIPGILTLAPLFLGMQVLAVTAYGALSSFFGLISKRYLVFGVIYGLVVEVGIARIPTNINSLALSRHIKTLMANHEVIRQVYGWSPQGTLFSVFVMVLAAALFLAAGLFLFTFREYHHSEEMQK